MKKFIFIIALPLLILPGLAQSRNCLRILPIAELTRSSTLIARAKVHKVGKATYRGAYNQLAILKLVDVIEGDFTLKQVNVLARSNVPCAEDNYIEEQEMLVFLEPAESLFHTANYQYGQFLIVGETVKGWRDKNNNPIDKPYAEVRQEIEAYVNAIHSPPSENQQEKKPNQPPPLD
ncbi:MAG TPA: hypothetical protein VNO70_25275 [Blastocatellia bacterium]|nr:hypothetical protein [Blastocatellia bacterium]